MLWVLSAGIRWRCPARQAYVEVCCNEEVVGDVICQFQAERIREWQFIPGAKMCCLRCPLHRDRDHFDGKKLNFPDSDRSPGWIAVPQEVSYNFGPMDGAHDYSGDAAISLIENFFKSIGASLLIDKAQDSACIERKRYHFSALRCARNSSSRDGPSRNISRRFAIALRQSGRCMGVDATSSDETVC
jgi:hypothetical protein